MGLTRAIPGTLEVGTTVLFMVTVPYYDRMKAIYKVGQVEHCSKEEPRYCTVKSGDTTYTIIEQYLYRLHSNNKEEAKRCNEPYIGYIKGKAKTPQDAKIKLSGVYR